MATSQLAALYITVFLLSMSTSSPTLAVSVPMTKPGCSSHCGNVEIPYPFGIEPGCYINEWFQVLCKSSTGHSKPLLNLTHLEVWDFSIAGTIRVTNPITFSNCSNNPVSAVQTFTLEGSPFLFSQKNRFTSISCNEIALLTSSDGYPIGGCLSICDFTSFPSSTGRILNYNSCSGTNCCQTTIPLELYALNTSFQKLNDVKIGSACNHAFLVDQDWFMSNSINISPAGEIFDSIPVVLDWNLYNYSPPALSEHDRYVKSFHCERIQNKMQPQNISTRCFCSKGFQGNPYLFQGCQQDIDECGSGTFVVHRGSHICQRSFPSSVGYAGLGLLIFLIVVARRLNRVIRKRKHNKRKRMFFKQNGGLLLQQQSSNGEVHVEKIKLFTSKELLKATDEFNVNRVLGHGSQGTVYKGMLEDGKIVAVKKSKIVDGGEVGEFINEIGILSQINHRNVVKLLGCCLETEVPLLVYEFILNGSLSQYIHHQNDFRLTWEMRLRVSMQVAGALSYLHSSTCLPIYHRDIKSDNILLDDKFNAKIADFGTSRSISIDKTHLTTLVKGTFGYLDPGYFQSSQFTDKSDVYSFGVVLVELLTGQKPVFLTPSGEWSSLATHFIESMEENSLFDIIDARVMKDGGKEEIIAVANLAKRCLDLNGKKRPTMKEVAATLEEILLLVTS
ncbi:wall-associated receptor kinase-like 22 [Rosa sericea]